MPAHHRAEEALEAYLAAGGLEHPKAALFQSVNRARRTVLAMVVCVKDSGKSFGLGECPRGTASVGPPSSRVAPALKSLVVVAAAARGAAGPRWRAAAHKRRGELAQPGVAPGRHSKRA